MKARTFRKLVCTALALLLSAFGATAEKRVAIVIGNGAYESTARLVNPANDATDMAAGLKAVGFEVILATDVNKRAMERAIERFARLAQNADAALFYYAGHGIQHHGLNYLVPIDARLEDEFSLNFELGRVGDVISALEGARGVKILILDACRNNPLADKLTRLTTSRGVGVSRGLARIDAVRGMIIAYATQPDQIAVDGVGRNSPFTSALLKQMDEPGIEIGTLFRRVAMQVHRATDGRQLPELSVSLFGEFYLNKRETDLQAWTRVRASAEPRDLREFLRQYPNSALVADAQMRIAAIERETAERARQRQLQEQLEQARRERERLTRERSERERLVLEQNERERLAREAAEREHVRRDQERLARQMAEREKAQAEQERQWREQAERVSREREKLAFALAERDRIEKERIAREAKERAEREQAERERASHAQTEHERLAKLEAERIRHEETEWEKAAIQAATQDKIARLTPPAEPQSEPAAKPAPLSDGALIAEIKKELQRVGCYGGRIDDKWSTAGTKLSVKKFAKYAKLHTAPSKPALDFLDTIRSKSQRVCPLECSAGKVEKSGKCVAMPAAQRARRSSQPQSSGRRCFMFSGQSFCE